MDVTVGLSVAGWPKLQDFQSTKQRFRSAGEFFRRVSPNDLADIKILLRRVEQMLSMAKRMACSTLSTYIFDSNYLNTERSLLTRHERSKHLQEPDQTPQDLT